jgi:molybdopterin synthase sulfur carrier subunit
MAIVVRIPTPLQKFTKQQSEVETTGTTIQDMLDELGRHFPGLREQLCDERGAIRKFVNLYLNNEDIRFMAGEQTVLTDGDEVAIIPAVAGGCASPRA